MPTEIRAKGSTFLSLVPSLESVRDLEYREQVVREMPGEGGDALRSNSLIAAGWYPISWYRDFLATAVRLADPSIVRQLGRISTRASMSTIHRILVRMLSPEKLIKQSTRVFASFFENATLTVTNVDRCVERIEWKNCFGFDKNVWRDQLGSTEEMVSLTGATLVRARVVSGGEDSDAEMVAEVAWK